VGHGFGLAAEVPLGAFRDDKTWNRSEAPVGPLF
jgi:hypothetical protein